MDSGFLILLRRGFRALDLGCRAWGLAQTQTYSEFWPPHLEASLRERKQGPNTESNHGAEKRGLQQCSIGGPFVGILLMRILLYELLPVFPVNLPKGPESYMKTLT